MASRSLLLVLIAVAIVHPVHGQSLADVAKKTEEERAKKVPDGKTPDKRQADDTPARETTEAKKTAFTNNDLKASTAPVMLPTAAPQPGDAIAPVSAATRTDADRRNAARLALAPWLNQMNIEIHRWSSELDILASMCSKESYAGLSRGATIGHRAFCGQQLRDAEAKEKTVKATASGIEDLARQKDIFPGTVRELFKELGWTP